MSGGPRALRMRKSRSTRLVSADDTRYITGSTKPHTAMMPHGSGSSMMYVSSKPVRSSTLNSSSSVCARAPAPNASEHAVSAWCPGTSLAVASASQA